MRRRPASVRRRPLTRTDRQSKTAPAEIHPEGEQNRFLKRVRSVLSHTWGVLGVLAVLSGLSLNLPRVANLLGLDSAMTAPVYSGSTQEDRPSVAVWSSGTRRPFGQEDVFWKEPHDNRLREEVIDNGRLTSSRVPGVSNVATSPVAAVDAPLNEETVYWTGTDDQLWEDVWAGRWSKPHDLEMGSLGSAPSVAVWPSITRNNPGQQDVFWKGSGDNRLWEAVMDSGWRAPAPVPNVSNVASAPAAIVDSALNQEDIFWAGTDGHLWRERWAGEWAGPDELAMGSLGSAPSVAAWPGETRNTPGQLDVFWKGSGDNRLWEAVLDRTWQGPRSIPGVSNVASAPTASVNAAHDREDIYWIGTDDHLWRETWAGRWSGPFKLAKRVAGA
jgi:hypothetical protein